MKATHYMLKDGEFEVFVSRDNALNENDPRQIAVSVYHKSNSEVCLARLLTDCRVVFSTGQSIRGEKPDILISSIHFSKFDQNHANVALECSLQTVRDEALSKAKINLDKLQKSNQKASEGEK